MEGRLMAKAVGIDVSLVELHDDLIDLHQMLRKRQMSLMNRTIPDLIDKIDEMLQFIRDEVEE
jgi:hypothetical protein